MTNIAVRVSTYRFAVSRGLYFRFDLISNRGQMTRRVPLSPNIHHTRTGRRSILTDLTCIALKGQLAWQISDGIGSRIRDLPILKPRLCHTASTAFSMTYGRSS
ncbi:hypothetical protein AVEN_52763-1 [Araneus ventricosus]|uniref:Uncharacterized protein n=1 Tax=Araneus ventricosus TaxID=182803 RepID=A0A4Y2CY69_ARAVE|nr:hypothetical protein AVEN_52763-1 [Araneus ventricosus]